MTSIRSGQAPTRSCRWACWACSATPPFAILLAYPDRTTGRQTREVVLSGRVTLGSHLSRQPRLIPASLLCKKAGALRPSKRVRRRARHAKRSGRFRNRPASRRSLSRYTLAHSRHMRPSRRTDRAASVALRAGIRRTARRAGVRRVLSRDGGTRYQSFRQRGNGAARRAARPRRRVRGPDSTGRSRYEASAVSSR